MAISYEGLKKLTGAGIVDGTIGSADIGSGQVNRDKIIDGSIDTDQIADGAVTGGKIDPTAGLVAAKFAAGAVDLTGAAVTGSLAPSKGGTGKSSLGAANQVLKINDAGNGFDYTYGDLVSVNYYTSNTTWNRPAGVQKIRVQICGAGGGGTGHGESGGAGGYAEEVIDVTGISSVSVTLNGGGGGVNYHNSAGNGGSSSFGPYLSASGGEGARRVGGHSGGRPGVGSGGNLNQYGGGGRGHTHHGGGLGGSSYFGGSSIGVHDSGPQPSQREGQASPGSGGVGAPRGRRRGGTGRTGICIVWNYK
jgi:hypothetical protein